MTFKERKEEGKLTLAVEGKIDTNSSPDLVEYIQTHLKDVKDFELDLEKVDYVSSAGLRAILLAQKTIEVNNGKMYVSHVCKEVMETFELTCFTDILTII